MLSTFLKIAGHFLKTGSRLRNKIFISVAAVAVMPFLALGIIALYVISVSHNYDVASIEAHLVNQKVEEVKSFVNDQLGLLEVILSLQINNLVTVLQPNEPINPGEIVVSAKTGERIKFLVKPDDLETLLQNLLASSPAFEEVYFVDAVSGREVSYQSRFSKIFPDREKNFTDVRGLTHIAVALEGERSIGLLHTTLRGPIVSVAAPVKNKEGKVVGALAGQLNLSSLKKVFRYSTLGKTGYVYLLDTEGRLIYHSDPDKFFPGRLEGVSDIKNIFEKKNSPLLLSNLSYNSLWGEDVIAAARSTAEKDFQWLVIAEWPKSDANQVVNDIRNHFIIFGAIVLMLTVFLSIFLTNRIVEPVLTLQDSTKKVSEGKFDEPVTIDTNDEIEDLGVAFNEMVKGLKRLKELREEFIFIAAHELRTPVTAIQGYISFVLDEKMSGQISGKAREFLSQVTLANKRLQRLVEDLLEVARSEAGRLKIEVSSTAVPEVIEAVLIELKPLADQKSIQLLYESTNTPNILADSGRMKEIMVNLVGNAIKYTIGSGIVTITHEVKGDILVTNVTDTGIGMSKEAQTKLFEKFYRIQTEKTRDISGTGLGLFIVRQIIEKMNGKIWVASEEGKGSTFSFSLPLTPYKV